jgi:hypothetical protein
MNNGDVQALLDACDADLVHVEAAQKALGVASPLAPYLTKYALIRACGAIEVAYKAIVADFCSHRSKAQVKSYLTRNVRRTSRNPSYTNICKLLQDFDESWNTAFKGRVQAASDKDELLASLQSLVDARNEFAHGGAPTVTLGDVSKYFRNARTIVEMLDGVVCS